MGFVGLGGTIPSSTIVPLLTAPRCIRSGTIPLEGIVPPKSAALGANSEEGHSVRAYFQQEADKQEQKRGGKANQAAEHIDNKHQ